MLRSKNVAYEPNLAKYAYTIKKVYVGKTASEVYTESQFGQRLNKLMYQQQNFFSNIYKKLV